MLLIHRYSLYYTVYDDLKDLKETVLTVCLVRVGHKPEKRIIIITYLLLRVLKISCVEECN
jgi:hypothetical protein